MYMMVRAAAGNNKKKNGNLKLKVVAEKLQKSLFKVFGEGVKGHFAVIAVENDKAKRFVVHLSYLSHPAFLTLLEQAAEEFEFVHQGVLSIPCQWSEMERILASPACSNDIGRS